MKISIEFKNIMKAFIESLKDAKFLHLFLLHAFILI